MKKAYTTKTSSLIMEYIKSKKEESFDTQEVFEYLSDKDVNVNLTTVYRNLEKLAENNVLVKFKSSKSSACLYRVVDPGINCHRHLHLQCKRCGRIYHLDGAFMNEIDKYVKNQFNFDLDCANSVLTGVCPECANAKA